MLLKSVERGKAAAASANRRAKVMTPLPVVDSVLRVWVPRPAIVHREPGPVVLGGEM
jgi:hypothetical protein